MKHKVRLHKTGVGGDALRTNTIDGEAERLPIRGRQFIMTGKGLEFGTRYVQTSPVARIIERTTEHWRFQTESGSVYTVELFQ